MNTDIVIVGGGMVGAATACALQDHCHVTLVDASPLDANEDHRLIALNHSSIAFLKNLKVWDRILPHASPIQTIHISHQGHFGTTRLSADDIQLSYLGYVIPAKFINEALYQQFKTVTLHRPATLTALQDEVDLVYLQMNLPQGTKELNTQLLIAADGTYSTVRNLADFPSTITPYHQTALVTTTELRRPHHATAYERFRKLGAIAMLPLLENKVATIWTDHTSTITSLMELSDEDFLKELQQEFGYRLGKLVRVSKRFTYPLQMLQTKQKRKGNIILLGNAAHTLHPIAAQGFNLALFEIAVLRDFLTSSHPPLKKGIKAPLCKRGVGGDLGDCLNSLSDFAKQQERLSIRLSHSLSSLFAYDFFPMNTMRTLGLIAFDSCQPLKKTFINQVLGRSRALPIFLRDHETQPI